MIDQAEKAIQKLNILNDLAIYHPVLCGTIPLGIQTQDSDLDIIMEVYDFEKWVLKVKELYCHHSGFRIKQKIIRDQPVVKANFYAYGFKFELFGQAKPVHEQYAYLHMVIESKVIKKYPSLKPKIRQMKEEGFKTEPAFCQLLGLNGDPYEALIEYGIREKYVKR